MGWPRMQFLQSFIHPAMRGLQDVDGIDHSGIDGLNSN